MVSQSSASPTNIRACQNTNNFDPEFSLYENYTNYEKQQLHVREITSWGPSHSSVYPHGEPHFLPKKSEEEECPEERCSWRKYSESTSVRVREGGYTGNELIEVRGEDVLKTCYTPLTDPAANTRPASWRLASPMWKPEYEVAAKRAKSKVKVPWWARPTTESVQPLVPGEIQMSESQKWQRLLEKMRQERELQTS